MADPIRPKKTKGQQKIEVKTMDDAKRRSVTFTKRRAGLFKKADHLCNLTGAEVALMVFSPGGKPYTFGNPDVDRVIARYKNQVPPSPMIERQKAELREIMGQLAYEDKRAEELRNGRRQMMGETWMAAPFQTLSKPQQQVMTQRMVQLDKMFSQPPSFNSFGFLVPPPDWTFQFPSCSFTSLLTQNPQLHGSSGLSCGSFMAPVTGNQNFRGNMVLTPSGNFYTGQSSSAAAAGTGQNHMVADNMMVNNNGSFYTYGSSSMALAGTQKQTFGDNMILTPPGNFYTGESSSVLPAWNQNYVFEDNMMLNSHCNFYTGESSSMVPAETHNNMYEDNMIVTPPCNFYTGELSSMVPAENLNNMFEHNRIVTPPSNFYTGESSSMAPAETETRVLEDNMMLDNNDSVYTGGSSSMASESQSIMFDDDMMLAANYNDNFFTSGFFTEEPTLNQIIDENSVIPPHDNFHTGGSSAVVPPRADENQIFDENIMVPPHDNYYTFESSVVPPTDDESLFFDENLRLFLGDQFYAGSSSMVPPVESQKFDENVMPPPPCDGYGSGPSGFN